MRIQSVGAPNACIRLAYRLYSHENTVCRGIMRVLDYPTYCILMRIQYVGASNACIRLPYRLTS